MLDEKEIVFSETVPVKEFSVFALNSIWIRKKASILSGYIGARSASSGPWLKSKVEVYIDKKAEAKSGIYGDSVVIEKKATVVDVYYNELINKGEILGEKVTPIALPVWDAPPFVESVPGTEDIKVKKGKTRTLSPGIYDDVKIDGKGELRLSGGTYHFANLELDKEASVICLSPAIILIKERLECKDKIYIGPDSNAGGRAKDVVLYIGGFNGKKGRLKDEPKAADIGKKSQVRANIYAPNGTLWIRERGQVEGSFIAKDVIIGKEVKVRLDTAFSNGQP